MHVALRVLPGKGKDLLYEQAGLWAVDAPSPCLALPSALPSLKGPESGRSWRWAQWSGLPSTVRSQFSALGDWANVASSLHCQSLLGFSQVPEALALWKPTERWSLAQGNKLLSASMKYTWRDTWGVPPEQEEGVRVSWAPPMGPALFQVFYIYYLI